MMYERSYPLSTSAFTSLNEHLFVAYENDARKSTQIAAEEVYVKINQASSPSKPPILTWLMGYDKNEDVLH